MNLKFKKMIVRHEGKKSTVYKCSKGFHTIGVGRNLEGKGLSEEEISYLLNNDYREIFAGLCKYKFFTELNPDRRDAIVDMAFMGLGKFAEFKNLIKALTAHDYELAAKEMLDSKWADQVGNRAKELAEMIRTGSYVE